MSDKGGIIKIADYDAGDAFCTTIGVECVGYAKGLALKTQGNVMTAFVCLIGTRLCMMGHEVDRIIHFSSMSCLCPGFVRSATVLLNSDINWP